MLCRAIKRLLRRTAELREGTKEPVRVSKRTVKKGMKVDTRPLIILITFPHFLSSSHSLRLENVRASDCSAQYGPSANSVTGVCTRQRTVCCLHERLQRKPFQRNGSYNVTICSGFTLPSSSWFYRTIRSKLNEVSSLEPSSRSSR